MTLLVRPAAPADLDRLLELHSGSYPDARGMDARRRNFMENPLGGFDRVRVAEEGGRVVGHAFLFALEGWFGGRAVPMCGLASLAVAAEARGRGVAGTMLDALHAEAHDSGAAITVLYAFRQAFYARHGYATTTPSRRLVLSPRALPKAWGEPRLDLQVRPAGGADRDAIEAAYARAAVRTTGWLTRPAGLWQKAFLDERRRWFVAVRGAAVVGFLSFAVLLSPASDRTTLTVSDLVADDDEARRALWGLVAAQRDQVEEVHVQVDATDPIDRALLDADAPRASTAIYEHSLGALASGPMVRLAETTRALLARGYSADGTVELDVAGERLRLEVHAGQAQVSPSRASAVVTVPRPSLAAIAYGALAPSAAVHLGWLDAPDAGTLRAADALFALPPYLAVDPF